MFRNTVKHWALALIVSVLALMASPASAAPDWFKTELVKAEHFGGDKPKLVFHLRYTNTGKDRVVTKVYGLKLKLCFYDVKTKKGMSFRTSYPKDSNVTINPGKSVEVKKSIGLEKAGKLISWLKERKEFDLAIKDVECEVDHKAK